MAVVENGFRKGEKVRMNFGKTHLAVSILFNLVSFVSVDLCVRHDSGGIGTLRLNFLRTGDANYQRNLITKNKWIYFKKIRSRPAKGPPTASLSLTWMSPVTRR
jgi:hypothetical protein